jgi:CRISPR-associated protein Cst2
MKNKIASIGIVTKHHFEMHKVNADESTYQKSVDEAAAVSGQKYRHMIFESMALNNELSAYEYSKHSSNGYGDSYFSNGDGISGNISKDIRSDLGGFMHPQENVHSRGREGILKSTYSRAHNDITYFSDTMLRLEHPDNTSAKTKTKKETGDEKVDRNNLQRILEKPGFSVSDRISFGSLLDISLLSSTERCVYDGGRNLKRYIEKHVSEDERVRRAHMYIDATNNLKGMANQTSHMVDSTAQEVFIVFNHDVNSRHINFFRMSETEKSNYLRRLNKKGVKYFYGNNNEEFSVDDAYDAAHEYLSDVELLDLSNGEVIVSDYNNQKMSIESVISTIEKNKDKPLKGKKTKVVKDTENTVDKLLNAIG